MKRCNLAISLRNHRCFLCMNFRQPNSAIFVFGEHSTKPNRSVLMSFNTNREETLMAETDFRAMCATACVNGEYICLVPQSLIKACLQRPQYCLLGWTDTYVNTVIEVHWLYCSTRVENVQICFQIPNQVSIPQSKKWNDSQRRISEGGKYIRENTAVGMKFRFKIRDFVRTNYYILMNCEGELVLFNEVW